MSMLHSYIYVTRVKMASSDATRRRRYTEVGGPGVCKEP